MMTKKYQNAVEMLKTFLICLLFLCAVSMSALYFYRSSFLFSQKNTGAGGSDSYSDSEDGSSQLNGLVLPETVAVKSAGEHMYAITQGEGYVKLIYRAVCKNISVALSDACTAAEGDDAVWENACLEDDFMLVKFHAPLLHSVIYADAASNKGEEALAHGIDADIGAIDQIFIFPKRTAAGDVFAMVRNSDGKVFTLSLNERVESGDLSVGDDFDIYINASAMTTADLYCHTETDKNVLCSTVLHSHGLNSQKISLSEGYAGIVDDAELCGSIATFFDINPDKNGNYYDENTLSTVYVATHGSLHIGENTISYSSAGESGGIPLSNYSDIFSRGGIDTTEAIILSQLFISGYDDLDRRFLGGDAHPVLSAVYSDGGTVTLEYIYCYSNVEIEGSGIACKLSLKDGKIVKFEAGSNIYDVSEGGERRQSLSPAWRLNMSLPKDTEALYTLKYRYFVTDMFAEWVAVKIK